MLRALAFVALVVAGVAAVSAIAVAIIVPDLALRVTAGIGVLAFGGLACCAWEWFQDARGTEKHRGRS